LYGHEGLESDLEIQQLMILCLAKSGLSKLHVDLGHVAVFRGIIKNAAISQEMEAELFAILQNKDMAALRTLCTGLKKNTSEALLLLPELYGDKAVLQIAKEKLPPHKEIVLALNQLEKAGDALYPLVDTL